MNNEIRDIYQIRDYNEASDKAFVLATFLRGLYYGNEFFNLIPKDIFMDNYKKVAEAIVNKSIVVVACLKEDPDVILGYSVLSTDFQTVHWVYVKSSKTQIAGSGENLSWRDQGIGKSLIPANPTYFSHFTQLGLKIAQKMNLIFDPFKL